MHSPLASSAQQFAPDPYSPHTGDSRFLVTHYGLELACKLAGNRLDGTATLQVRLLEETERIELDLVGLRVTRVSVNGAKANFKHRQDRLSVPVPRGAAAGDTFEVVVRYGGAPGPRMGPWGDVGWEELEDGVLVAGQPDGASTWFPCNDTPGNKATYAMSIATDAGYRAVAPGRLVGHRRTASRETWSYEELAPTPSYLATLQIGRYSPLPLPAAGATALEVLCTDAHKVRAATAFKDQPAMLAAFEAAYGAYPFEAYQAVVTEDALEIPLEAQGLSIFGENHLSTAWEAQRLIAHELSHQWFGNSLTVSSWRDLWMHEGFACYSEWVWSEASGSRTVRERAQQAWDGLAAAEQDLAIGDPGPQDMFDDRVYKRGALTVLALREAMGAQAFTSMLHAWTAAHRHGSVNRALFEDHLRSVSEPGQDLSTVLVPWLDQEALPAFPMAAAPRP